jgi:hypothetical protein
MSIAQPRTRSLPTKLPETTMTAHKRASPSVARLILRSLRLRTCNKTYRSWAIEIIPWAGANTSVL